MAQSSKNDQKWWKESVIYQVYPASFRDVSGDGWGDIKGIIEKVPYLKELGVDVLWVSPIYKSPQADMGYDISDYKDIDPRYGTLQDVDDLISTLKSHGMKLMMDLVVNHTSNEHDWFLESARSKDSPKRDWYIWKPPKSFSKDGIPEPPNNWAQLLGEANSAWTWDEQTGEYYLSLFTPEQPDLNWENEEVREAVHDVMHFWLNRGASGFRMDVINLISKVQTFPDAPILHPTSPFQPGSEFFANGPRLHEYLHDLYTKVLSQHGKDSDNTSTITVGEMPFISSITEILRTVGAHSEELNMIFIFDIVDIDNVPNSGFKYEGVHKWALSDLKKITTKWQRAMIEHDGWNSLFLENHDQPRSISRYCDDSDTYRDKSAKLLALMQTTLSGTLFVYQGEEFGMRNVPAEWDIETEYKDVESQNLWKKYKSLYPNNPKKWEECKYILQRKARDHARTPVQWSAAQPNAGFCDEGITPWMRVNTDYKTVNAESSRDFQSDTELSVWQFWQRGLKDRKEHKDVFVYGDYEELTPEHEKVFAYIRKSSKKENGAKWITVLNFSGEKVNWELPAGYRVESWVASTYVKGRPEGKETNGVVGLEAWEGILGKVA